MSPHRYDVDRDTYTDGRGMERLSGHWRLVCRDCDWVGRRVHNPSTAESKARLREWEEHVKETL